MNVEVKRQKDNLCQQIAYWGYGSVRFLGTFALVARSFYYLRHGCPSVYPLISARLPLERFSWNLIFQTST